MKYKKTFHTGTAILCIGVIVCCQTIRCIAQSNSVTVEAIYQQHKDSIIFTTTPYQAEALGLVLQEANKAARQLNLPENLPITVTNLTDVFINPFEYAYEEKSLGSVASAKYYSFLNKQHHFEPVFFCCQTLALAQTPERVGSHLKLL